MRPTYDALLLVSFGGPEGPDDVLPFLENVLRGRNVPRERMLQVAEHYYAFGGVSPINEQNRGLIDALREEFARTKIQLPIYWGNRNWHPLLTDTMRRMAGDGIRRALALFTSTFSSYSGCRQYREDIARAQATLGEAAPQVDKIRGYFNHPGFINAMVARVNEAVSQLPQTAALPHLMFTAHSIPRSMSDRCQYVLQLRDACRSVAERGGWTSWELVYQSRSGPPTQPWLEPDVCDRLKQWRDDQPSRAVILAPIGFVSDHMEVQYDLDTEARELCDESGITMVRARTVGRHPLFIQGLRQLVQERLEGQADRPTVGELDPLPDVCPEACCLPR